jgi:hypothetical protein
MWCDDNVSKSHCTSNSYLPILRFLLVNFLNTIFFDKIWESYIYMGELTGHKISKVYLEDCEICPEFFFLNYQFNYRLYCEIYYGRNTIFKIGLWNQMLYHLRSLLEISLHKIWWKKMTNCPNYSEKVERVHNYMRMCQKAGLENLHCKSNIDTGSYFIKTIWELFLDLMRCVCRKI